MVEIEHLKKIFGSGDEAVRAIDNVSLDVAEGELLVMLGPSGCGKTTVLRCLAGLETADSGRIRLADQTAFDGATGTNLKPNQRDVGMVFQSYALWPHKKVRDNIAYPIRLRHRNKTKAEVGAAVDEVARLVDCSKLLDRYPSQLSGGQQQRVALARGLAAQPGLVLFDEPLSNLDALLRHQVRSELNRLHEVVGFTGVYVTHDQAEALALADRLAVMRAGQVEQLGTPEEIFETPLSEYVADFIGYANRVAVSRRGDGWYDDAEGFVVTSLPVAAEIDRAVIRFRTAAARLADSGGEEPRERKAVFTGRVVSCAYAGTHREVTIELPTSTISIETSIDSAQPAVGTTVAVAVEGHRLRAYEDVAID